MNFNRRQFIKGLGAGATLSVLGSGLTSFTAGANQLNDYKALVCVFLYGGMDNYDTVLPYDLSSYNSFTTIRESMMSDYAGVRERDVLLPLSYENSDLFGDRRFALPPEMSNIHGLFEQGDLAIVGNIGPLIQPMTTTQYHRKSAPVPPNLFSHNNQQSTWQSNSPEGSSYGWGGLFADALANQNSANEFSTVSTLGSGLFLNGLSVSPYLISASGGGSFNVLNDFERGLLPDAVVQNLKVQLSAHSNATNNVIQNDIATLYNRAFSSNSKYNDALAQLASLTTSFPENALAEQLQTVAKTIAMRDTLGMSRQVFFVGLEGFDTHSDQGEVLPSLLKQLDESLSAFYKTMQELDLSDQVTLFTTSEFGRTLASNGDGTDHGWGSNHFVMGGAVKGKQIVGNIPPIGFDHENDVGGGRLLPDYSVEQMAAPLGEWFGLSESELHASLPNLKNFDSKALDFI